MEMRVEEEIQKQESLMTAAGVESRTKRRCVIMREKMNKKKEWWEEEGLGSESEEDNERDIGTHRQNQGCEIQLIGEFQQLRRPRQRKLHLKINVFAKFTIFRLFLVARILFC